MISNKCDRCGKKSDTMTMSWFNMDMICMGCDAKEKAHPMYGMAKRIENEQCRRGNYNFEGIGLPEDLMGDN